MSTNIIEKICDANLKLDKMGGCGTDLIMNKENYHSLINLVFKGTSIYNTDYVCKSPVFMGMDIHVNRHMNDDILYIRDRNNFYVSTIKIKDKSKWNIQEF